MLPGWHRILIMVLVQEQRWQMRFTSGRSHDFTNPVQYVLTAPDGVTNNLYGYSRFYDETQNWFRETEHTHTWDAGVITKGYHFKYRN